MCVRTSFLKTQSVPATMVKEVVTIWNKRGRVTILSEALRGGLFITSWSTGSTPRLTTTHTNTHVCYTYVFHVYSTTYTANAYIMCVHEYVSGPESFGYVQLELDIICVCIILCAFSRCVVVVCYYCRPLCWRSVHDDVDPEDLHGIEWVGKTHHCR